MHTYNLGKAPASQKSEFTATVGNRSMARCWLFKAAVISALALSVLYGSEEALASTSASDSAALSGGKDAYEKLCQSCHGVPHITNDEHAAMEHAAMEHAAMEHGPGEGDAGVITDMNIIAADLTRENLLMSVAQPHPEGGATWKLDASEISQVVAYVMEAFVNVSRVKDMAVGERIFSRTCSVCHGEQGNAASWAQKSLNPPPFDFTSYKAKKLSKRHMLSTVTYGRDKTAMVGFATQLSPEEIVAVVDYIRQEFIFSDQDIVEREDAHADHGGTDHDVSDGHHGMDTQAEQAEAYMRASFNGGLVGDADAGQKLYDDNCTACHGKEGDGDGPRAYFIFPKPENFSSKRARAELNRPHLFSSISAGIEGTVMPAWSKVLSEKQIADIAEYVFIAFTSTEGASKKN